MGMELVEKDVSKTMVGKIVELRISLKPVNENTPRVEIRWDLPLPCFKASFFNQMLLVQGSSPKIYTIEDTSSSRLKFITWIYLIRKKKEQKREKKTKKQTCSMPLALWKACSECSGLIKCALFSIAKCYSCSCFFLFFFTLCSSATLEHQPSWFICLEGIEWVILAVW